MDATTYDQRDDGWRPYAERPDQGHLPPRPRRQYFNKWTAALVAAITCAAGFYAGVRVEKGQSGGSTTSGAGGLTALAAAVRGAGAGGSTGAGASSAGGSTGAGASSAPGAKGGASAGGTAGGAAAGPGAGTSAARGAGGGLAAALGGGSASFGTITTVKGDSLYVTGPTGNVVKVHLSSSTKISKSLGVKRSALHPGDSVVIRGLSNSKGTMVATSVSDSGASAAGTGGARSSSSGSSAVSSLFSSGGSGG
jgi:hypothetical protein